MTARARIPLQTGLPGARRPSSAVTARPDRSARRVGVLAEDGGGPPLARHGPVGALRAAGHPGPTTEIRERLSGNIAGAGAYPIIVAAEACGRPAGREAMTPSLRRGGRPAGRPPWAAAPGAAFLAGGTGLIDLMKLHVNATPAGRRDPAAAGQGRGGCRRRRSGSGRMSATATSPPPARSAPLPGLSEAVLSGASGQLGTRRPPAATCCSAPGARTSGTSPIRQQTRPTAAAGRATGPNREPRCWDAPTTASPPIRRTWASPWRRWTRR